VDLLRRELPTLRPECLRLMEVATTLLQKCAAAGLTLADIGGLMSRPLDALDGGDLDNPSELERACVAARQVRGGGVEGGRSFPQEHADAQAGNCASDYPGEECIHVKWAS
jgi:hypothetical protein